MPIPLEGGVQVNPGTTGVEVKGPKGTLSVPLPAGIGANVEDQTLTVVRRDDSKPQRSLHGLTRALLANAVIGVTRGFSKQLEIRGVGYRAEV
jgi:large subunit ribosomal protein L6